MIDSNTLLVYHFLLSDLPHTASFPLTDFEISRLKALPPNQQSTYRKTRNILRAVLLQHHIDPSRLSYTVRGKPIIATSNTPVAISLTHSQDTWLVALCSGHSLGVDLQIPQPRNPSALKKRCNLPASMSTDALVAHWTMCEAFCKYQNTSLFKILKTDILRTLEQHQLYHYQHNHPHFAAITETAMHQIIHIDGKKCINQ